MAARKRRIIKLIALKTSKLRRRDFYGSIVVYSAGQFFWFGRTKKQCRAFEFEITFPVYLELVRFHGDSKWL